MWGVRTNSVLVAAAAVLAGCAMTTAEVTVVESGAVKLTNPQIETLFTNAQEKYVSRDRSSEITAVAAWGGDQSFSADWESGSDSGTLTGRWYIENDMRCVEFDQDLKVNPECVSIYRTDGGYTSFWPDGSIHGLHTVSK